MAVALPHWLDPFRQPASPRTTDSDPVSDLAARTLHSLLIGLLLWVVLILGVAVPFFAARKLAASGLALALLLAVLASLFCLRKGRVTLASWILLSSAWLITTLMVVFSGGIASRGLLGFTAIIVTSAWLLGRRIVWWSTGVFLAMTLVLAFLENAGVHLPRYFVGPPFSVWMTLLLFVAIATLPVSQVLWTLESLLARAHQQVVDLKRHERALEESEERFRSIVQMAPDGIFIVDSGGRFLEVNEAACLSLGYKREQLLERGVLDIVPGRFADQVRNRLETGKESGAFYESSHVRADGSETPVEVNVGRIVFEGQPAFIVIARDVTERKRVEQERLRLQEKLRQAQKL